MQNKYLYYSTVFFYRFLCAPMTGDNVDDDIDLRVMKRLRTISQKSDIAQLVFDWIQSWVGFDAIEH
jgi:hypothetical protein